MSIKNRPTLLGHAVRICSDIRGVQPFSHRGCVEPRDQTAPSSRTVAKTEQAVEGCFENQYWF